MKITFLGTGTSQGIPVIACECVVCASDDKKDKRLRSSVLIEHEKANIIIDTGPDFRAQMLNHKVKKLDAVVYTHEHKDHIAGLDDIRAFNYRQKSSMPVYATEEVQIALKREYAYIFSDDGYPGIPRINLHTIDTRPFDVAGIRMIPIEVMHYKLPVLGFRIGDFTYITDAKSIRPSEMEKAKGTRYLVLNALRKESHIAHLNLEEAVALASVIKPEKTYFTHISHLMGKHEVVQSELPYNMYLAQDGLTISV